MRSNENFTSSAVISPKPSVNIWPGFSRNSTTVGDDLLHLGRGVEFEFGGIRLLLHQALKDDARDVAVLRTGAMRRIDDDDVAVDADVDVRPRAGLRRSVDGVDEGGTGDRAEEFAAIETKLRHEIS